MILSKRVALGGDYLDELDDSIVIRSVDPGVAHESTGTVNRMGGWGSRLTNQHWESRDVTVSFAIDIPKRELTVSSLGVWTAEGYRALRSLGIAGVSNGAIVWAGDMWTRVAKLGGATFDAGAGEPTVTGSTKPGDMWIDTNQGDLWKAEDR